MIFPRIYCVSECWEREEHTNEGMHIQCMIMSAIVIARADEQAVTQFAYRMTEQNANTKDYRYAGGDQIRFGFWWLVATYIRGLLSW